VGAVMVEVRGWWFSWRLGILSFGGEQSDDWNVI